MGTPHHDRDAIVPVICQRMSEGETLSSICRDIGVPRRTVNNWRKSDPAIAAQIQEARDLGFDAIADECMAIADTPLQGEEVTTKPDGTVETRRGDMLGHRKLQVETRLKLLAKWDPKRYGDKHHLEHTGPNGGPMTSISTQTDDPVKAAEIYQKVMAGEG